MTSRMLLLFIALGASAATLAQTYPQRPIRIIVPYAPGGSTDLLARTVGGKLSEAWGQSVMVDNRPGASAMIGTEAAVKAPADGYTIMIASPQPIVLNKILFKNLKFDPEQDLVPISINLLVPNYIVAHPSLPARTVKELIAFVKANRGKVSYASSGSTSTGHLTGLLLNRLAGLDMEHIGYKGSAPATTETLGGHVPILIDQPVPSIEHVRSGSCARSPSARRSGSRHCRMCRRCASQGCRNSNRAPGSDSSPREARRSTPWRSCTVSSRAS